MTQIDIALPVDDEDYPDDDEDDKSADFGFIPQQDEAEADDGKH